MSTSERESIVTPWARLVDTPDDTEWLIDGLIPAGHQTQIVGATGIGKSLLALGMVLHICEGSPFMAQHPTRKGKVLWLDYENGARLFKLRLAAYGYPIQDTVWLHDKLHYSEFPDLASVETQEACDRLEWEIDTLGIDLVVIDSFAKAFDGDENDSRQYRQFGAKFGNIARSKGVALLILDNLGKNPERGGRGSGAKKDDTDIQWLLQSTGDDLFTLTPTKDRLGVDLQQGAFRKVGGPPLEWRPQNSGGLSLKARGIIEKWVASEVVRPRVMPTSVEHARKVGLVGSQRYMNEAVRWLKVNGINDFTENEQ